MKLPNGSKAVVDIRKLRNYCLDPASPKGRNKARVFAAVGITQEQADFLRRCLLTAASEESCTVGELDDYGQRYTLDLAVETPAGRRRVRSGWIVLRDEDFPRLTTCFVLGLK